MFNSIVQLAIIFWQTPWKFFMIQLVISIVGKFLFWKLNFFFYRTRSDWPLNDETRESKRSNNWIHKTTENAWGNQTLNSYWIETLLYFEEIKKRSEAAINAAQSEYVLMSWVWRIHLLSEYQTVGLLGNENRSISNWKHHNGKVWSSLSLILL